MSYEQVVEHMRGELVAGAARRRRREVLARRIVFVAAVAVLGIAGIAVAAAGRDGGSHLATVPGSEGKPSAALVAGDWQLLLIEPLPPGFVPSDENILRFAEGGLFDAKDRCNHISGHWTRDGSVVTFTSVRTTAADCPQEDVLSWSSWRTARVEPSGEQVIVQQPDQRLIYVRAAGSRTVVRPSREAVAMGPEVGNVGNVGYVEPRAFGFVGDDVTRREATGDGPFVVFDSKTGGRPIAWWYHSVGIRPIGHELSAEEWTGAPQETVPRAETE